MSHCFQCGTSLEVDHRHERRRVVTGGLVRKKTPRGRGGELQTRYGMRIVCKRCAYLIDRSEGRILRTENLKLGIALTVFVILVLLIVAGVTAL